MDDGEGPDATTALLKERTRDLELAARIGQSLLDQNKELQNRNEFLEESLATTNETVIQLRHELQKRVDLLRLYSNFDENDLDTNRPHGSEESLRNRVERLSNENALLRSEQSSLQHQLDQSAEKERKIIRGLNRQLEAANDKLTKLQHQILGKTEECIDLERRVKGLMNEITYRTHNEKQLVDENDDLKKSLDDACLSQELLSSQLSDLQEKYAEVRLQFSETEEELRSLKARPQRSTSRDSLFYDSLASELENSDSGFSSTPYVSARSDGANLRRELERLQRPALMGENDVVDVPNPVIAEVAMHRVTIQGIAPATPPQTPMSQKAPSDHSTPTRSLGPSDPDASRLEMLKNSIAESLVSPGAPIAESTPHVVEVSTSRRSSQQLVKKPPVTTSCMETQTDLPESFEDVPAKVEPIASTSSQDEVGRSVDDLVEPTSSSTMDQGSVVDKEPRAEMTRPQTLCFIKSKASSSMIATSQPSTSKNSEQPLGISKSSSTDSLVDYVGPKLGEPGMPGTRDLDHAIRQLRIRRQWMVRTICVWLWRNPSGWLCGLLRFIKWYFYESIRSVRILLRLPNTAAIDNEATENGEKPMEAEFARFRERCGLPQQPLFKNDAKGKIESSTAKDLKIKSVALLDETSTWNNYAVVLGQEHQRAVLPWRAVNTVGLSAIQDRRGHGVLSRTELPTTPQSSPVRALTTVSITKNGLASILPSFKSMTQPGPTTPFNSFDFTNLGSGILSRRF